MTGNDYLYLGNDHLPKAFTWKMIGRMSIDFWENDHSPKAFSWKNDRKMIGNDHLPENAFGSGKCF